MRPRVRIALSLVLLILLGVIAGAVGARHNRTPSFDPRRSTVLTGPNGARAYAESLRRLGVTVSRFRERTARLDDLAGGPERPVLALLDPRYGLDGTQAGHLLQYLGDQGDLLLSGPGTRLVTRCFGYDVDFRSVDSTPVFRHRGGRPESAAISWTGNTVLAQVLDTVVVDSSDATAGLLAECAVLEPSRVDTLLSTEGGRPAAVRLTFDSLSRQVTLVADGMLFSNARMKDSDAGLVTLALVAGRYPRVIFDEYEHGFGPSGSLLDTTIRWSLDSPYGWAFWQLAVVGVVALLAGAIRFGAARKVIQRRRRSALEHVRALATALSAAKGSHVAVDLLVRGLRRRLTAGGPPSRGDLQPWLAALAANVRTDRSRQAVTSLVNLTRRAPVNDSVLRAADAVEDVWQDLKPPLPNR
jgi:hypothetical protein